MKKSRLYLPLVALLLLTGLGLLLWPANRHREPVTIAATPHLSVAATSRASTPSIGKAIAFRSTAPNVHKERTDSLAIGNLLADPALDDKAVMTGLARMTLESNRAIEERTEAMAHLLNLSVADPEAVLLPLISDARLPDSLCNQILDDALNGSLTWQADACFDALKHRDSAEIHTKARDHLVFLLKADHGDNFFEWSTAIALSKEKWVQSQK